MLNFVFFHFEIDDIFDAWRTLSKFQINKWVNFKTQMSRTKKPFLRHVEKCLRIRHFDVEKLDDYDIADLFKDYDRLFHCNCFFFPCLI